jgi:AraC-like DNA-binding protein
MLQRVKDTGRPGWHAPTPVPSRIGEIRLGPLRSMAGLMREMGHDPAVALAAVGVEESAFDNPDRRLPLHVGAALIQYAAWTTGRKDFGLLIGQRFEIGDLGLLGQLLWRAQTVGQALHDLQRFIRLQDRGSVTYVHMHGDGTASMGYSVVDPDTPGVGLVYDTVMSIAMTILRTLCGPRFKAIEVSLAHAQPDDVAAYRRCFAAPVRFNATRSEVRFEAACLQAPVAGADAALHAAVLLAARSAEARNTPALAERVRGVVQALLIAGDLSAARVADAMGLHERTLRRRLADEGTSLRQAIAAARFEVACQLLRETDLRLNDIAHTVGYAEASVFLRAFRAWAGCTPAQWRERAARGALSPPAVP